MISISVRPVIAQSNLSFEASQGFSTFGFSTKINDPNTKYSYNVVGSFNVGYEHTDSSGLSFRAGAGIRKAGASLIIKDVDYVWNTHYADIKAGIGYGLNKWMFNPYGAVSGYYAYLLDGEQFINGFNYDIKGGNNIKSSDYGIILTLGVRGTMAHHVSIYGDCSYLAGMENIETTAGQLLYNRGLFFKLGVSVGINSFKKTAEQPVVYHEDLLAKGDEKKSAVNDGAFLQLNPDASESETPAVNGVKPVSGVSQTGINGSKTKKESVPVNSSAVVNGQSNTQPDGSKNTSGTEKTKNEFVSTAANTNANPAVNKPIDNTSANPVSGNNGSTEKIKKDLNSNPASVAASSANTVNNTKPAENKPADALVSEKPSNTVKPINAASPAVVIKEPAAQKKVPKTSPNIVFKVQITAAKHPMTSSHPVLKNLTGRVEAETGKDGWIRYYMGSFNNYDDAKALLNKLKSKGEAQGGFVVVFKKGKKITVAEANDYLK